MEKHTECHSKRREVHDAPRLTYALLEHNRKIRTRTRDGQQMNERDGEEGMHRGNSTFRIIPFSKRTL